MEIKFRKFQQGGAMPEQGVPAEPQAQEAPAGAEDPMMQLIQAAAQALQGQDCNLAMQVCQALVQLVQSSQDGAAPAPEETEPVYRRGGTLVRRIRK